MAKRWGSVIGFCFSSGGSIAKFSTDVLQVHPYAISHRGKIQKINLICINLINQSLSLNVLNGCRQCEKSLNGKEMQMKCQRSTLVSIRDRARREDVYRK